MSTADLEFDAAGAREATGRRGAALGFWTSVLASALTITFVVLAIAFPGAEWTDMEAYARMFETIQVAQLVPVLILAPVVVILMTCLHAQAPARKRVFSHVALMFSLAYATIITTNYVVQLYVVRLNVLAGNLDGLALMAVPNPRSVFAGLEILGYGFFGLMALFAGLAMGTGQVQRWIRRSLIVSGITGVTGATAGLADQRAIMLSGFGLSLLAFLAAVLLLSIHFKAHGRKHDRQEGLRSLGRYS